MYENRNRRMAPDHGSESADNVRRYLDAVWYRKWSCLVIVAVTLLAAYYFTSQQPKLYSSSARVLLKPFPSSVPGQQPAALGPEMNLPTQSSIAASSDVTDLAAKKLKDTSTPLDSGELMNGLSVSPETDSQIIDFAYTARNPGEAQAGAQAVTDAYLKFRQHDASRQLNDTVDQINARITAYNKHIKSLRTQLDNTPDSDPGKRSSLQGQVNVLTQQRTLLKAQIFESSAQIGLNVGSVVQSADLSNEPSSPSYRRNFGVAFFSGLVLAIAFALMRERFDPRVRGRADIERAIAAPVLAIVPHVTKWRHKSRPFLVTATDPHSPAAESYRTLRTAVLFAASQHDLKVLLLTSARAEEGKTSTTANLALALAQSGKKVIAVAGDMRKPRLAEFFRVENNAGLASVLTGSISVRDALVATPHRNLRLLTSGPMPPNPADLLVSERMAKSINELRSMADFVLVDTAPALLTSDALSLVPHVDGVLFVTDGSSTTPTLIAEAQRNLANVEAPVIGAVLNNVDASRSTTYGGGYGYYAPDTTV